MKNIQISSLLSLYKKYGNTQTSVGVKLSDVDENGIYRVSRQCYTSSI